MREQLRKKLISELAYSSSNASKTSEDLCNLKYADLKEALLNWLRTDTQSVIQDGQISTILLMERYHMPFPAALIFLEWYRESPKAAISVLKMRM